MTVKEDLKNIGGKMREIKFRAWSNKFNLLVYSDNDNFKIDVINLSLWKHEVVDSNIELMQYTGLKDCEGKEIYEGDIIVVPEQYPFYDDGEINYIGVVEWVYSGWQYILQCVDSNRRGISNGINEHINDHGFDENSETYYKVIGNIYENKELLE